MQLQRDMKMKSQEMIFCSFITTSDTFHPSHCFLTVTSSTACKQNKDDVLTVTIDHFIF